MHPVAGEPVSGRVRLGLLVLVVREDQIYASAMNVERRAEILGGHRRALQVPARAALAPRGGPEGLTGFCRLPQRKVAGVTFAVVSDTVARRLHLVDLLA